VTIITSLVGLLGRFAGQLLNTTLGWATLLLFGKVPQNRQVVLLVMVFGSIVWVALLVGVLVPAVGVILVAAVPLPGFIDPAWVRVAMLAGALFVPLLIGLAAMLVTGNLKERGVAGILVGVLRGYPFSLTLTLILGLLAVVAVARKVRSLARRWQDAHVPMVVKPGRYEDVLARVSGTLADAGLEHSVRDAGKLLSGPPKVLDLIAGRGLGDLVPDHLRILDGRQFEVLVYPSDLAISGTRELVARARAALASRVSEAPAYLTMTAEAQAVEDEMDELRAEHEPGAATRTMERLRKTDETLAGLPVPFDEWQTLYRERLQLERNLLRDDEAETRAGGLGADHVEDGWRDRHSRLELGAAIVGLGLVALDVALVVANRRNGDG